MFNPMTDERLTLKQFTGTVIFAWAMFSLVALLAYALSTGWARSVIYWIWVADSILFIAVWIRGLVHFKRKG